MNHAELGHANIIKNLRSQAPDTVSDVHTLRAALETVGFNVKCYYDCNVQVYYSGRFVMYIFQLLHNSDPMRCIVQYKNFKKNIPRLRASGLA